MALSTTDEGESTSVAAHKEGVSPRQDDVGRVVMLTNLELATAFAEERYKLEHMLAVG